jgi:hypothetical protein
MLGADATKTSSAVMAALAEGLAQGATKQRADGSGQKPLAPPPPPPQQFQESSDTVWYVAGAAAVVAVLLVLLGRSR